MIESYRSVRIRLKIEAYPINWIPLNAAPLGFIGNRVVKALDLATSKV